MPGSACILPAERDAVRETAREAEDGPECKTVASAEQRALGDHARQRAQGAVFAAQQIIGEIQGAEYIQ